MRIAGLPDEVAPAAMLRHIQNSSVGIVPKKTDSGVLVNRRNDEAGLKQKSERKSDLSRHNYSRRNATFIVVVLRLNPNPDEFMSVREPPILGVSQGQVGFPTSEHGKQRHSQQYVALPVLRSVAYCYGDHHVVEFLDWSCSVLAA